MKQSYWVTKLLLLLVSCPYNNLQSSRYTKTVAVKLHYNNLFTNDVIFIAWKHGAIAWSCFDDGIC